MVEDEDLVRTPTSETLRQLGYVVLEAKSGEEALRRAARHPGRIDVLLTDVVMPGLSGPQLAERVAASHPELRVLYISGYTDDAIVHHGVLDPGVNFLQKPFTQAALGHRMAEVLGRLDPPETTLVHSPESSPLGAV